MTDKQAMVGAGGVLLAVLVFCALAVLKLDLAQRTAPQKQPVVRTRDLGEDLKVGQHGLYGVDLVTIGHAHMRKMRRGPFTIGAINELVLENATFVLPESLWKKSEDGSSAAADDLSPQSMLSAFGLAQEQLQIGRHGQMPRFSALCIKNLLVSRLDGTNVVTWFGARLANASARGLKLKDGWSNEAGVSNAWKEAMLQFKPELQLFTAR